MKRLHRKDLYCWARFYEPLDIDFHGFLWARDDGNVAVDPLPLSPHDAEQIGKLGGVRWIVLTNSDHLRGTLELQRWTGARICAPIAEREHFPLPEGLTVESWLADGDVIAPGLMARALDGSKTPGELALVLDENTLICGDLVRAHRADTLMLLKPEQGLKDRAAAIASIDRVVALHPQLQHVLCGDGWHVFRHGRPLLQALVAGA